MYQKFLERLIGYFTIILFVLFTTLHISFGGFVLAVILCIIIGIYLMKNNNRIRIRITYYHLYVLIFTVYIVISSTWAIRPDYSIRRVQLLIELMFAMIVIYTVYSNTDGVNNMLKILMWRGYIVLFYIIVRYGVDELKNLLNNNMRIDNDAINANVIGLLAAYSIIINIYFIIYHKHKVGVTDVFIFPAFIMLVISGSRKGLVLVCGGVAAVVLIHNWNSKKIIKATIRIALFAIILAITGYFILKLPFMTGIMRRMSAMYLLLTGQGEKGLEGYLRLQYIKLGMELFRKNPLHGIGIDNTRVFTLQLYGHDHYLHNNYVEILAGGGIIGIVLYYWIYVFLLISFWKYRIYRDGELDICFILLVCVLIMDYGKVSYSSKETYLMLLLLCLERDELKRLSRSKVNKLISAVTE